jgi:hypothetical protein
VRRWPRLLRETVIEAESAADHEQAIGNLMRSAEGEFLHVSINDKGTHFESNELFISEFVVHEFFIG